MNWRDKSMHGGGRRKVVLKDGAAAAAAHSLPVCAHKAHRDWCY